MVLGYKVLEYWVRWLLGHMTLGNMLTWSWATRYWSTGSVGYWVT